MSAKPNRKNNDPKKSKNNEEISQDSEFQYGKHVIINLLESKSQINKLFLQKGISGPAITDIKNLKRQLVLAFIAGRQKLLRTSWRYMGVMNGL